MMSLVLLLAGLAVFFTIALKLRMRSNAYWRVPFLIVSAANIKVQEVADMPAKLIKAPAGPEAYLKN